MRVLFVAVFGATALVFTAGPAAAENGVWRSYSSDPTRIGTSTWECGYTDNRIASGVSAQVCAIRTANKERVQAAVIVHNRRTTAFSVKATAFLWDVKSLNSLGSWDCRSSGVGAESWSVCFGITIPYLGRQVEANGTANDAELGFTNPV